MLRVVAMRSCAVLLTLVLIGCSSTCRPASCLPHGTYIELNPQLDTASAQICFDDTCSTVKADEGFTDVFTGFNSDHWVEGQSVQLHLTVFDSANKVIDTITEQRTMDSSGCACGVLYYTWQVGHLHRKN